jgi:hypothetical protein
MSGASEAANELRAAVLARYDELRAMVSHTSAAVLALRGAGDLMDVLREADKFSLALEALAELTHDMHVNADKALVVSMGRTGCPAFQGVAGNVYTRNNPAGVDIHDPAAVPDECMVTPEPKPDKAKIRAYLKDHPGANFASLRPATIGISRRSNT